LTAFASVTAKAYHEAVQRFSGAMLATARSMLDPATAEDVVQETWVAVIDAIDGFEGRSALKTWLCTITANRARNRLRKSNRETLTDFQAPLDPNLEKRFNEGGAGFSPRGPGARSPRMSCSPTKHSRTA